VTIAEVEAGCIRPIPCSLSQKENNNGGTPTKVYQYSCEVIIVASLG
jgi:hypothetical protein